MMVLIFEGPYITQPYMEILGSLPKIMVLVVEGTESTLCHQPGDMTWAWVQRLSGLVIPPDSTLLKAACLESQYPNPGSL